MQTAEEKLRVLARIAERLNAAHITWAVGASLLLYFHGITDTFHDLDLMVADADAPAAGALLRSMGSLHPSAPGPQYRTKYFYEFTVDGVEVDLIGGFAIVCGGTVHDCSLRADTITGSTVVHGQTVPLQSVSVWRDYYAWMGREAKVRMIDAAAC